MEYIAHKIQNEFQYKAQTVKGHLMNTADLCSVYAGEIHYGDAGKLIGILHDIGKYSNKFQNRIQNGAKESVDHSTAGGKLAVDQYGAPGQLMAYCIMGHHGGLPNGGTKANTENDAEFLGRLNREVEDYSKYQDEIELPKTVNFPKINPAGKMWFGWATLIKMLYSCLVDADFQDTENFMQQGAVMRGGYQDIASLEKDFFSQISVEPKDQAPINLKRNEILRNCIDQAGQKNNLFTLTVPTGGGKTLSSMAFALKHAVHNQMKRIIYVIPYTSIIEQNAKVFKNILGAEVVLEHHSNFDFKDKDDRSDQDAETEKFKRQKLSSENWDIPIVVTTNVQFFESFFANKSSKCRKLHNIANSVIILDEAQMLPNDYLKPCLNMLAELVVNYGSTVVLCSATQPAIAQYMPKNIDSTEICNDVSGLYNFFKRTTIVDKRKMTNEQLVFELEEQNRALCIVNTKKHALDLFARLKGENTYHLSTSMCPVHRKQVLEKIKNHLQNTERCIVISTQLIEAGVDVDFPSVYRAVAGLDSIVQSAGRCNREWKSGIKEVYVFEPEPQYMAHMPNTLRLPIEVTKSIFRNYDDVTSPEAIKKYFEELYQNRGASLDSQNIMKTFEEGGLSFPFKDIAEKFKLIDNNTRAVIIPFQTPKMEATDLIEQLRYSDNYRGVLRSLQGYTVNLYDYQFQKLFGAGKLEAVKEEVFVLRDMKCYKEKTGIDIDVESGIGLFF